MLNTWAWFALFEKFLVTPSPSSSVGWNRPVDRHMSESKAVFFKRLRFENLPVGFPASVF